VKTTTVLVAAFAGLVSVFAQGADAPVAWEETFDGADVPKVARFYYEQRGSGKTGDDVVIKEVSGGVFKFGLKVDPERKQDRVCLRFGDPVWGPPSKSEFGPFDLKEFPFVEMKWRGDAFTFYYGIETADGKRLGTYTFPPVVRTETDDAGREWNVSLFRGAPDSSVPTKMTAVKLLGLNFVLYSPSAKDISTEFDTIRVRGFAEEEAKRETNVIGTLKDFPQGRWPGFDTFFPWGVYIGYLRSDFESWGGDYEGAYGNYARHHFNFVPSNDEVEVGRFSGQESDQGLESYIKSMGELVDAARATGIRLGGDIRRMMDGKDAGEGYAQIAPVARRIAEAFADDDVIVSWKIADEPGVARLLPLVSIIRAIREADPLKRPELIEFNATSKFASFASYLSLNCWDNYPVLEQSRNPWAIRELARAYRKLLPEAPMWAVLPSFETRPPAPKGSYIRPSDAEIRMMAYLAVAEGAKGICWYAGWSGHGRDEGLVSRTGRPRGGMMATLCELGERLIPIGQQLLATDPVEDARIKVAGQEEPNDGHALVVSALKHRDRDVHFLVAVNEDLDRARGAKVTLPSLILKDGQGVYDLDALDGGDLAKGKAFAVAALAGGDGRIYAVCSRKYFHELRTKILSARALEAVRVLTPDLTIARRWTLPLDDVDEAIARCKTAVEIGAADEALTEAHIARARLFGEIDNHSELAAVRRALRDIRIELAEVSRATEYYSLKPNWWTGRGHPMLIPNPGFLDLSKRYFEVGRSYRDLYTKYLKGDRRGLWTKLNKTRLDCLAMREDVLAFLREKLKPEDEPPK